MAKVQRALIQTVGLVADPLIASLRTHRPDLVVFVASADSSRFVQEALEAAPVPDHAVLTVDDPESMDAAFRAGRRAYRILKEKGAEELLVDPTGGTKTMVAGLSLALAGLGFTFVYVGGAKRDAAGKVITGHERVRTMPDPTERYHVFEQRAFMRAWNEWRMPSAAAALEAILKTGERNPELLSEPERRYFEGLLEVTRGMHAWDLFRHKDAHERLSQGLPKALAEAEAWGHEGKLRVLGALKDRLPELEAIAKDNLSGRPTFRVLADLLANAERRAEVGRYDDALARLYRAVELALEAHFFETHHFFLDKPKSWPQKVQRRVDGRRAYGLFNVLERAAQLSWALQEKDTLPLRLYAKKDELRKLTDDRNKSILAHGVVPVEKEDYEKFKAFLRELGLRSAEPWPRWWEA